MRENDRGFVGESARSGVVALIFSVISILILALIMKLFCFSNDALPYINQALKLLCVLIGVIAVVSPPKCVFKGAIGGVIFALLSTVVFLLLGGEFGWGQFALDIGTCLLAGSIGGAIANVKKSK